jgi:hypothetical protein
MDSACSASRAVRGRSVTVPDGFPPA